MGTTLVQTRRYLNLSTSIYHPRQSRLVNIAYQDICGQFTIYHKSVNSFSIFHLSLFHVCFIVIAILYYQPSFSIEEQFTVHILFKCNQLLLNQNMTKIPYRFYIAMAHCF